MGQLFLSQGTVWSLLLPLGLPRLDTPRFTFDLSVSNTSSVRIGWKNTFVLSVDQVFTYFIKETLLWFSTMLSIVCLVFLIALLSPAFQWTPNPLAASRCLIALGTPVEGELQQNLLQPPFFIMVMGMKFFHKQSPCIEKKAWKLFVPALQHFFSCDHSGVKILSGN